MQRLFSPRKLGLRLALTLSAFVVALLAAVTGVTGALPVAHADPPTQKVLALPFSWEQQFSYCGPASAQMTLQFIGPWFPQSTLASQLGTDDNGTPWGQHKMGTTLNIDQPYNYYVQVDAHSSSESTFSSNVIYNINHNFPVIIGIYETPAYNIDYREGRNNWRHYIVIDGYYLNGQGGPPSLHFTDPAGGGGTNRWFDAYGSAFTPPSTGWTSLDTAWNMMYQGNYGWVW